MLGVRCSVLGVYIWYVYNHDLTPRTVIRSAYTRTTCLTTNASSPTNQNTTRQDYLAAEPEEAEVFHKQGIRRLGAGEVSMPSGRTLSTDSRVSFMMFFFVCLPSCIFVFLLSSKYCLIRNPDHLTFTHVRVFGQFRDAYRVKNEKDEIERRCFFFNFFRPRVTPTVLGDIASDAERSH